MIRFSMTSVPARIRRVAARLSLAAVAVGALAVASCSVTDVLDVTDPDIINPSNVTTPAGADAARVGALARFNTATSGGEGLFLLGGLFTDEFVNGDSFIARWEIDQRTITPQNDFLNTANRVLHRARLSAEQAIDLMQRYNPSAPGWQVAEMYFVRAFVMTLVAEHYCDGVIFSTVVDGRPQYGSPMTTAAALEEALKLTADGLALITGSSKDDVRVKSALQVTRGRILMNLNRPAEAATAVAGVQTSFKYFMRHSATTNLNQVWEFNNNAGRYSVSDGEGTNGIKFATANDPRVPVCLATDPACKPFVLRTTQDRDDKTKPLYVQKVWGARDSAVAIIDGVEARIIEAEAQLRAGKPDEALATLNAARATVAGLTPLADAGSEAARVDQLFRERAFWFFGRGHRVGDMRRLIRQYGRQANTVFPVGAWHKGGNYGPDVNFPVPFSESNNPNMPAGGTCMNRNA